MASPSSPQRLLTMEEAADRLAVTEEHLRRVINRGHLRPVNIAGAMRISERHLDDYIAEMSRPTVFG